MGQAEACLVGDRHKEGAGAEAGGLCGCLQGPGGQYGSRRRALFVADGLDGGADVRIRGHGPGQGQSLVLGLVADPPVHQPGVDGTAEQHHEQHDAQLKEERLGGEPEGRAYETRHGSSFLRHRMSTMRKMLRISSMPIN